MVSCTAALLSGCATTRSDSYCDLSSPIYFGSQDTVDYLEDSDVGFLRDILTHNETWKEVCDDN